MRTDSFENFGEYKDVVNKKLDEFIQSFENKPLKIKKLLHYQSVINLSKGIIKHNNSEANILKDKIIEYIELVKNIDYTLDNTTTDYYNKREKSLELYQKYLAPIGYYLISENGFGPDLSLKTFLFVGILSDITIYYLISKSVVPLATILVVIFGIMARNKRRKNGKFFSPFK